MKNIIFVLALLVFAIGGLVFIIPNITQNNATSDNTENTSGATEYYNKLRALCEQKSTVSKSCCLASVDTMEAAGARLAKQDRCPEGMDRNLLRCPDTLVWCEKKQNNLQDTAQNQESEQEPQLPSQELPKVVTIHIPRFGFNEDTQKLEITFTDYQVPYTKQVLNATYKKLFQLRSPDGSGIWNGMRFDKAELKNGKLTVYLSGQVRFAGDLSGAYFQNEIEAAAFQYPSVKSIEVLLNGKPFDWCVDDMRGGVCEPRLWITKKSDFKY